MKRFIEGEDRRQATLLPDSLEDYVTEDNPIHVVEVSTPEQDCIGFRSKNASMMPTRMPSSAGLSCGRQDWVGSSLGASALLRRERRLL